MPRKETEQCALIGVKAVERRKPSRPRAFGTSPKWVLWLAVIAAGRANAVIGISGERKQRPAEILEVSRGEAETAVAAFVAQINGTTKHRRLMGCEGNSC